MSPTQSGSDRSVTRRTALAGLAGATTIGLTGCSSLLSGQNESAADQIEMAGSSTVYPLMSTIAGEYESDRDININIRRTGTGAGFADYFTQGETDFNNASRQITDSELQDCQDNGIEPIELALATDAVTVVVSNDAPVDSLTLPELRDIWRAGGADTWSDVRSGLPDEEIERYGSASTSGTYDFFIEKVLEGASHTDDYQATEQDNTIINGVQGNPNAIGYFGFSFYYENQSDVTAVALDDPDDTENGAVAPSIDTASNGTYPLTRSLYTYVAKDALRKDHIAYFAMYALNRSTDSSLVTDDVGYVPNTPDARDDEMTQLISAIRDVQSQA